MTHDLNDLADKAEVTVDQQHEQPVLEALSRLSVSAGRYPVAVTQSLDTPDPNEWLGYGSAHPIMRTFFERVYRELESAVPEQIARLCHSGCVPLVGGFRVLYRRHRARRLLPLLLRDERGRRRFYERGKARKQRLSGTR
jgi:hypothetical protein